MRRSKQTDGERIVKDIKRKTRRQYSAEESERSAILYRGSASENRADTLNGGR